MGEKNNQLKESFLLNDFTVKGTTAGRLAFVSKTATCCNALRLRVNRTTPGKLLIKFPFPPLFLNHS